VVEYEPDPDLRDTEQVPLLEEGGIEAFLRREVLPHAPDAWYVPDSVKIGYEISFTRYFYKPQPLRTLEEIRADILALESRSRRSSGPSSGMRPRSATFWTRSTRLPGRLSDRLAKPHGQAEGRHISAGKRILIDGQQRVTALMAACSAARC
jgi:hypothetical protein